MTEAPRVIILDHTDTPIGELDPTRLRGLVATSVVNGEHALEVTTTQALSKNDRLLYEDGRGYWHEYVVEGIETEHGDGGDVVSTYYCVWSLQHDLGQTFVDSEYGCGIVPGHASVMHPASDGLTIALSSTQRWTVGAVTVTAQAAASFYRRSGWEALQTVIEKWGGELQASIDVDASGVVSREVDLLQKVGQLTATRRFDYGGDVSGIVRTVADDPWTCRIIPLGKGQETEEGGYTRRPTIASVNGDVLWLENSNAVNLCRVPDGAGGWEYPVQIVYNDTYEEPADLKAWALEHLTDYTQPKVSYEADVIQLARAGMSPHGVSLGDEVAVVDRGFGADGLQIEARVLKIVENLLDASDIELTISTLPTSLADQMSGISSALAEIADQVSSANVWRSSGTYVSDLISRINAQANATGGYTYVTEGDGIRTYDAPVSDPLVGAEASKVVEVKGGTIRIANTKDSGGNWEWKTLIVSGLVAAECIAAMSAGGGGMAQVVSDGLEVLDENGNVVSKFGVTSRVGMANSPSVILNPGEFGIVIDSEDYAFVVRPSETPVPGATMTTNNIGFHSSMTTAPTEQRSFTRDVSSELAGTGIQFWYTVDYGTENSSGSQSKWLGSVRMTFTEGTSSTQTESWSVNGYTVNYSIAYDAANQQVTFITPAQSSSGFVRNYKSVRGEFYSASSAMAPLLTFGTRASGDPELGYTATFGDELLAGSALQTVAGYGNESTSGRFVVGCGYVMNNVLVRRNGFIVDGSGNASVYGTVTSESRALGWVRVGVAGSSGLTFTLPAAGTYLLVTGHNSSAGSNGIWIVRTGGNKAWNMAGGGYITVTVNSTSMTVKTSGDNVNVYYERID